MQKLQNAIEIVIIIESNWFHLSLYKYYESIEFNFINGGNYNTLQQYFEKL